MQRQRVVALAPVVADTLMRIDVQLPETAFGVSSTVQQRVAAIHVAMQTRLGNGTVLIPSLFRHIGKQNYLRVHAKRNFSQAAYDR